MGAIRNRREAVDKVPVEFLRDRARICGKNEETGEWIFRIRLKEEELRAGAEKQMKADCILCTQLQKMTGRDEIRQELMILDWSRMPSRWQYHYTPWEGRNRLVSCTNNQILFWLFAKGFEVEYPDGRVIHYVRFERSANMSRNGMISYINEERESELLERITLGLCRDHSLDWLEGGISLSKWEAYKGLALSDAYRMDRVGFDIRRVAVIPDRVEENGIFPEGGYFTGRECGETENGGKIAAGTCRYELIFRETDEKAEINYFDGEGLVMPEFGLRMEQVLYPDREPGGCISSFQIRMPFVKGMIHCVNFREFLEERGVTEIRDIFGRIHRAEDLDLILTKSQFKAYPWFKTLYGEEAWEHYQEKFEEYGHTLFVANFNKPALERGREDYLNYQVLHSLGLERTEFEELAQGSLEEVEEILLDHRQGYRRICTLERPEGEEDDPGYGAMVRALHKNPELIRTPQYQNELIRYQRERRREIQSGRLKTQGSVRFFAGDLMMLLNHLLDRRVNREDPVTYAEPLEPDEFYAPAFWGTAEARYGIFRNPHMARNEHAWMRCRREEPGSERDYYLGRLEGVLMVNPESMAAERMAGADYDGDIVNVVDDERYSRALERRSGREDVALIVIPSPGTALVDKHTKDLEKREYQLLLNQIGSMVGMFSYMAFCKAAQAYGYDEFGGEEKRREAAEARERVRDFTVQVGLEIDSVKSGKKPVISDKLWTDNENFEPFLKNEKAETPEDVPEYHAWRQELEEEGYANFLENHGEEIKCNMNLLPLYTWWVYPRWKKDHPGNCEVFPKTRRNFKDYFDRTICLEGKQVKADRRGAEVALGALQQVWSAGRQQKWRRKQSREKEVQMTKEQKQIREKMMQILYQQYTPETAQEAFEQMETFLSPLYFGNFGRKNLSAVRRSVIAGDFALARKSERRAVLWSLLEPLAPRLEEGSGKEAFEALFTNFSCGGHQLLNLALGYVIRNRETPSVPETAPAETEEEQLREEEFLPRLEMEDRDWLCRYYRQKLPEPSDTANYLPRMREEALAACRRFHPEAAGNADVIRKLCMNYCLNLTAERGANHSFVWAVCGRELAENTIPQAIAGINDGKKEEEAE